MFEHCESNYKQRFLSGGFTLFFCVCFIFFLFVFVVFLVALRSVAYFDLFIVGLIWLSFVSSSLNARWLSQRVTSRNTGAYSFQNAFFYLQFADDVLMYSNELTSNPALRASLITQRKTRRLVLKYFLFQSQRIAFHPLSFSPLSHSDFFFFFFFSVLSWCLFFIIQRLFHFRRRAKLHPQKQRSKYICKPDAVVEAGNHFVWEFITGRGSLNVPADAGILHHYRVCMPLWIISHPFNFNFQLKYFIIFFSRYANSAVMIVWKHHRWWTEWHINMPIGWCLVLRPCTITWKCHVICKIFHQHQHDHRLPERKWFAFDQY